MKESRLLEIDGFGNIALGLPLIIYPDGVARLLGVSFADGAFYPVVLGSLLIGIGIALLVERFAQGRSGLGLAGAISINMTLGVVLIGWLLVAEVDLPRRGSILLWGLALILIGISVVEFLSLRIRSGRAENDAP